MSDAKEDVYAEAGIAQEPIGFGERPAVVVVDLQLAFTDPGYALGTDLDDVVEANAALVDAAHEADVPVYYTRVVWREDFRDAAVFAIKAAPDDDGLVKGSPLLELDPRLPVTGEDHVVDKEQPSGFFNTELDTMLTFERVDTTIVGGATTSGCVRATVVDACSHGYRPMVPVECVGDRAEEPHEANLFDMDSKYADVVTVAETLGYLASR